MTDPSPEEVEAVARAICGVVYRREYRITSEMTEAEICQEVDRQWPQHTSEARAAIAAMPEREVKASIRPFDYVRQCDVEHRVNCHGGSFGYCEDCGKRFDFGQISASDVTVTKREDGSDQVVVG